MYTTNYLLPTCLCVQGSSNTKYNTHRITGGKFDSLYICMQVFILWAPSGRGYVVERWLSIRKVLRSIPAANYPVWAFFQGVSSVTLAKIGTSHIPSTVLSPVPSRPEFQMPKGLKIKKKTGICVKVESRIIMETHIYLTWLFLTRVCLLANVSSFSEREVTPLVLLHHVFPLIQSQYVSFQGVVGSSGPWSVFCLRASHPPSLSLTWRNQFCITERTSYSEVLEVYGFLRSAPENNYKEITVRFC